MCLQTSQDGCPIPPCRRRNRRWLPHLRLNRNRPIWPRRSARESQAAAAPFADGPGPVAPAEDRMRKAASATWTEIPATRMTLCQQRSIRSHSPWHGTACTFAVLLDNAGCRRSGRLAAAPLRYRPRYATNLCAASTRGCNVLRNPVARRSARGVISSSRKHRRNLQKQCDSKQGDRKRDPA